MIEDEPFVAQRRASLTPFEDVLTRSRVAIEQAVATAPVPLDVREVGMVHFVEKGIARVRGLSAVGADELLLFEGGVPGLVFNLDEQEIGAVLLGESAALQAGTQVLASGHTVRVPVGDALLGRTVSPLGSALDGKGAIDAAAYWPVERQAAAIVDRAAVNTPLQTGVKVVDALFPIGRGQRELILGDRQIGKTALAVDAMINQRATGVRCIYCAIGQRGTAVARVVDSLRTHGAIDNSIVVCAQGEDPPGLQFLAPYAAMSMAEWFMERGEDVLLVMDDLTRHARAYRELSLLMRRPPGREAYPGDIFYVHSRLLERAAHVRKELGGGSITALPIIETQAGDISAYIPTNLISITDGQIYLSPSLFNRGLMPSVDVGRSVSRVGGKAQRPALRTVAGDLRLQYAQFEELESFSRFATRLDSQTRNIIERGRRVRAALMQIELSPLPVSEQVVVLLCVNAGVLDRIDPERVPDAERCIRAAAKEQLPALCLRLEQGLSPSADERQELQALASQAVAPFEQSEVRDDAAAIE